MRDASGPGIPAASLSLRAGRKFQTAAAFLQRRVVHDTDVHADGPRSAAHPRTVLDRSGRIGGRVQLAEGHRHGLQRGHCR
jgi:hypothetical protein